MSRSSRMRPVQSRALVCIPEPQARGFLPLRAVVDVRYVNRSARGSGHG